MPLLQPADIRARLDSSRGELLDQSMRNPLLNYRPLKARGVEAVEARAEAVYPLLVLHNRKLSFVPAAAREEGVSEVVVAPPTPQTDLVAWEEPPSTVAESLFDDFFRQRDAKVVGVDSPVPTEPVPDAEASAAAELEAYLTAAGLEPGDAEPAVATKGRREVAGGTAGAATALQTACPPAELHRRLLNTMLTARTFVEEQGVNTLFLALGMLTWREVGASGGLDAESTEGLHRSPLILVPVELERASAGERFTLRYTDEEITGNVSLSTYLSQNFQFELPLMPEREDLDVARYLEQVALLVAGKSGWRVEESAVALAFFSFNKYLMYKELEDAAWPAGQEPSRHAVLTALLGGGFHEDAPRFGEDDQLDRVLPPTETRTVVEADGSQVLAIEDVKQGRNLVIQGPPGTGKSQSITNIIAEALGQNKSVLFVSEKMAALEVVKRRLDTVGLGDACLELHSNKTNKKAVLNELKRTLALGKPVESQTAGDDLQLLGAVRDRLNAYCDAVNAPVGASGWTPHTLYGEWLRLQAAQGGVDLPRVELLASQTDWTSLEYRQREQVVEEMQAQIASMGDLPARHPYWGSARTAYVSTDSDEFRRVFTDARNATAALRVVADTLAGKLSLPSPQTVGEAEALAGAAQRAIAAPPHEGMQFSSGQWLARRANLTEAIELGAHLTALKTRYGTVLTPEAWDTDVRETRQAIAEHGAKWYKFLIGDWRQSQKAMRLLCQSTPPHEVPAQLELLDALLDYRRTKAAFAEPSALGALLFGAQWQGERSDWSVLEQLLQWIVGVHEEIGDGRLPKAFIDFLSGGPNLTALVPDVTALQNSAATFRTAVQAAVALLDFREAVRFGAGQTLAAQTLASQETLFGTWASEIGRLQQMTAFNHLSARCRTLDLGGVVECAATTEGCADRLVPAFQRTYYQGLLRQVFGQNPDLANFNGIVHGQTADKFWALDVRLLQHNRVALAAQHYQSIAKLNGLIGSGGGQLRILTKEFEKKIKHLPIRQLVEKAGHAIQAIKPVLMMSPLSVATFLPPGSLKFDLVVFDEASQVKPVDALGALARGTQAVVVGDSRQLPPTSFFDSLAQSDGLIDDENETADMESILGLFVGQGAPQRMLKWHYRSRHESLIAVSNSEFYDNQLVIFPSPDAARERLGLSYRYLPDTVYDRGISGTNRAEAKAVAEAALAHARLQLEKPTRDWQTLGIAAFSMGQMQAILDQLEILRRQNPDAETFFNASAKNEPFFVKNLENVQGDERDVIYISVGYGRDKNGQVSMNFGPLNKQGGERRLNVLISRARLRCEVFTNLLPDDIDPGRTSARGVAAFRTFLAYARSTEGPATGAARLPETPFEREVLSVLRANGFEIAPKVGCAGYFIDLAVVDAERPGHYLLGIECDGPNYQSARSARDRDRLRDEVLRAMGWRLHRIWSTDWIHRYNDEVDKLKAVIAAAQEAQRLATNANAATGSPETTPPTIDSLAAAPTDDSISDAGALITDLTNPAETPPISRVVPTDLNVPASNEVQPYQIADLPKAHQLDINNNAHLRSLVGLVTTIVEIESPIHTQEVSRRLASALGVHRLTDAFHAKVAALVTRAEQAGHLQRRGAFLWAANRDLPTLRTRAALDARFRNLTLIANEEIALAIQQVTRDAYGLPSDDIARTACRLLGFERVTAEMKERTDTIVEEMIATGLLISANGVVTAT